jgi:pantoate--beta-alanine ligase
LGEKDFQQLIIIEDFVEKNYKNIKVIGCKTIREKNGLPLSSRNLLLNSKEKLIGSRIYKIIYKFKKKLIKKEIPINFVKNKILALGVKKIEYICILNINKIKKPYKKIKRFKVFISYFLGSTRIIDNI